MFGVTILDIVIIFLLLLGGIAGFKKGIIKSAVSFVGLIIVIVLSYILKNPISIFLYTYLPFFKIGGEFAGATVLNILIYEAISFLIVFSILYFIFNLILKITRIVDKLLKCTLILTLPLKLLGLAFGILESYIIIFIGLSILFSIGSTNSLVLESKLGKKILENTPVLSQIIKPKTDAIQEIYELGKEYQNENNKSTYNKKAFNILLKYDIISPENAQKLVERNKLKITDADKIIEKYKEMKK